MALALVSPPALRPRYEFRRTAGPPSGSSMGDCLSGAAGAWGPLPSASLSRRRPITSASSTAVIDDDIPRTGIPELDRPLDSGREPGHRAEDGSLFLNVGAKPTDPWIPLEVAQVARRHFKLQNTIHWVKSIAIDREAAGAGAGLDQDVAVGHYKPINSDRFVNDCHEFIFHFSPGGRTRLDRRAVGVPYQDPSNIKRWAKAGDRAPVPRQHLVHSVRDDPEPRSRPSAPGVISAEGARAVRAPARPRPRRRRAGSVPGVGLNGAGRGAPRPGLRRHRDGRPLPTEAVARVKTRTRRALATQIVTNLSTRRARRAARDHEENLGGCPKSCFVSFVCFVVEIFGYRVTTENLAPICISRGPKSVLLAAVGALNAGSLASCTVALLAAASKLDASPGRPSS